MAELSVSAKPGDRDIFPLSNEGVPFREEQKMLDERALLYHEYELALETAKMYDEDRLSYYEDIDRLREQLDYVLRQMHEAREKASAYYRKANALLSAVEALDGKE